MNVLPPLIAKGEFRSLIDTVVVYNDTGEAIPLLNLAKDRAKEERYRKIELGILNDGDYYLDRYTYTTDPVTHRRIISKSFKINNVEVSIKGDEPSVTAVLNTLKTYPPTGPVCLPNKAEEHKYIGFDDPCDIKLEVGEGAPEIGSITFGDFDRKDIIVLMPNGTKFSGSGTIVFIKTKNGKIYLPVFSYINPSSREIPKYESLGGMISNKINKTSNILYENAIKESLEESAGLFHISKDNNKNDQNRDYVDIDSNISNTKYRSYPYFINVNTLDDIKVPYDSNVIKIAKMNNVKNYDYYRETNDIQFIDFDIIMNNRENLKNGYNVNFSVTNNGNFPVTISTRTRRVLGNLFTKYGDNLNKILSNPKSTKIDTTNNKIIF